MLSITVADTGGRTLSGQTLDAFLASVQHAPIFSIGLNCSFGAKQLKPFLKQLASRAPYYISAYPNAGLPNEMGGYDQKPEEMAGQLRELASKGLLNIAGGCCGTTPEHIKAIAAALNGIAPRQATAGTKCTKLTVSGLEAVSIDIEKKEAIKPIKIRIGNIDSTKKNAICPGKTRTIGLLKLLKKSFNILFIFCISLPHLYIILMLSNLLKFLLKLFQFLF